MVNAFEVFLTLIPFHSLKSVTSTFCCLVSKCLGQMKRDGHCLSLCACVCVVGGMLGHAGKIERNGKQENKCSLVGNVMELQRCQMKTPTTAKMTFVLKRP